MQGSRNLEALSWPRVLSAERRASIASFSFCRISSISSSIFLISKSIFARSSCSTALSWAILAFFSSVMRAWISRFRV